MSRRLYYDDPYLTAFRAAVAPDPADPRKVLLDQTAFYPTSGGQPFDTGTVAGARVVDVTDQDGRIIHTLQTALGAGDYDCAIDWPRRFDHMQQHTGQHVLSAVLIELAGIETVSFHMSAEFSTIDVTRELDSLQLREAQDRANQIVCQNRPVTVSYHDSGQDLGLRKPSEREGTLRVVSIQDLDRSACGGTHVRVTGEIGCILIRRTEKVRGHTRLEFVCGLRATRRARSDFEALSRVARAFSAGLDDAPDMVEAQLERLAESEKARRKLTGEIAQFRGRELAAGMSADGKGRKIHVRRIPSGGIGDELRAEAQAFCGAGGTVFVVLCQDPPSVLLAAGAGAPVAAGATLKPLLEKRAGRGGGNAQLAQGSLPNAGALAALEAELVNLLS